MNATDSGTAVCLNEGCVRRAEPGEAFCAACELERSLFDRDRRRRGSDEPARLASPTNFPAERGR